MRRYENVLPSLPRRFYPLPTLIAAVFPTVGLSDRFGVGLPEAVLVGVVVGFSASGFYSQGRTLIRGKQRPAFSGRSASPRAEQRLTQSV